VLNGLPPPVPSGLPPVSNEQQTANREVRLFFPCPDQVLQEIRTKFAFQIDDQEYSTCIGWIISRTAWLRTLYQKMYTKYPCMQKLPSPFDYFDTEMNTLQIKNTAMLFVLEPSNSLSSPQNHNLRSTSNHSNAVVQIIDDINEF